MLMISSWEETHFREKSATQRRQRVVRCEVKHKEC